MRVVRSKLEGVPYKAAKFIGAEIAPTVVVLHDTAGRLDEGNSADYLASSPKVSVHLVVERDGSVTQLVPLNRAAAHAGQSSFHGRSGCNGFSIGIEIVNPGRMAWGSAGQARAWWGSSFDVEAFEIEEVATPEHGHGLWMPYPEAQVAALLALLEALFAGVPSLRDITTHWYISPGRKVDVNPLFPLEHVRARILGRDDPAVAEAEAGSTPEVDEWARVTTSGSSLNLRRWPSYNPNVIGSVPAGTLVPVLRQGVFGGELWRLVRFDGREGWVVGRYTAPVPKAAAA